MKTNYKKMLKLTTLLIASLLIGTASASVYRYMYLEGTITVGAPTMVWIGGEDADFTISGSTATGTLNIEGVNYPMNFTRAIYLKNVHASATFNYNITVLQTLSTNDFSEAKIHVYENYTSPPNWNYLGTINLLSSNSYYSNTLAAGKCVRFTIEINATTNMGGTFKIQVAYWP
jgi:hypothetical protein